MAQEPGIVFMNFASMMASGFPRQFKAEIRKNLDTKFLIILGCTATVICLTVGIIALRPLPLDVSQEEILRIQERYATLVLEQREKKVAEVIKQTETRQVKVEKKAKPEAESVVKKSETKVDSKSESVVQRTQRREATLEQRRQVREEVQKQVQSSGIFAAITASGTGSGKSRSTAVDLLGASDGLDDLSSVTLSQNSFVAREPVQKNAVAARTTKTTGVSIVKDTIGTVAQSQMTTAGDVSITTQDAQITGESAGKGFRSQAAINKIVSEQQSRLKKVYEAMLKRDPSLKGKLMIKFTILPDGSVTGVAVVSSTTNNQTFDSRIVSYIQRWMFPPIEGGGPVEVVFPFVFTGYQ